MGDSDESYQFTQLALSRDTQVEITNTLLSNFRTSDYVNQLLDGDLKNRITQSIGEDALNDIVMEICSPSSIETLIKELTQDQGRILADEQRKLSSLQNNVRSFYWEYLIRRTYNSLEENSADVYSMLAATVISRSLYEYFTKFPEPFKT